MPGYRLFSSGNETNKQKKSFRTNQETELPISINLDGFLAPVPAKAQSARSFRANGLANTPCIGSSLGVYNEDHLQTLERLYLDFSGQPQEWHTLTHPACRISVRLL